VFCDDWSTTRWLGEVLLNNHRWKHEIWNWWSSREEYTQVGEGIDVELMGRWIKGLRASPAASSKTCPRQHRIVRLGDVAAWCHFWDAPLTSHVPQAQPQIFSYGLGYITQINMFDHNSFQN
jgi:hypothetical protein